jgi:hypothetical protein
MAFLKDEILLVLCNMGAIARRHRKAGRLQAMEYHPINPVSRSCQRKTTRTGHCRRKHPSGISDVIPVGF